MDPTQFFKSSVGEKAINSNSRRFYPPYELPAKNEQAFRNIGMQLIRNYEGIIQKGFVNLDERWQNISFKEWSSWESWGNPDLDQLREQFDALHDAYDSPYCGRYAYWGTIPIELIKIDDTSQSPVDGKYPPLKDKNGKNVTIPQPLWLSAHKFKEEMYQFSGQICVFHHEYFWDPEKDLFETIETFDDEGRQVEQKVPKEETSYKWHSFYVTIDAKLRTRMLEDIKEAYNSLTERETDNTKVYAVFFGEEITRYAKKKDGKIVPNSFGYNIQINDYILVY